MAEVITSGKVIQKPEIVLEPTDFLPPGILGVRTQTRDEAGQPGVSGEGQATEQDEVIINDDPLNNGNEPDADAPEVMPIPQSFRIISQTEKVGADGKVTIDVLIETDDFPGINEFEVRLTKSQL